MSDSTLLVTGLLTLPLTLTALLVISYLLVVLTTVCVDGRSAKTS